MRRVWVTQRSLIKPSSMCRHTTRRGGRRRPAQHVPGGRTAESMLRTDRHALRAADRLVIKREGEHLEPVARKALSPAVQDFPRPNNVELLDAGKQQNPDLPPLVTQYPPYPPCSMPTAHLVRPPDTYRRRGFRDAPRSTRHSPPPRHGSLHRARPPAREGALGAIASDAPRRKQSCGGVRLWSRAAGPHRHHSLVCFLDHWLMESSMQITGPSSRWRQALVGGGGSGLPSAHPPGSTARSRSLRG